MVHKELKITGQVQGVYYRESAKQAAQQLGVNGEVWNNRDGSVSLIAEGEESAVQALTEWCRKGPVRAEVKNVDVAEGKWTGYKNFSVKRF